MKQLNPQEKQSPLEEMQLKKKPNKIFKRQMKKKIKTNKIILNINLSRFLKLKKIIKSLKKEMKELK